MEGGCMSDSFKTKVFRWRPSEPKEKKREEVMAWWRAAGKPHIDTTHERFREASPFGMMHVRRQVLTISFDPATKGNAADEKLVAALPGLA